MMQAIDQVRQYVACVFRPDDWVEVRCLKGPAGQKQTRKYWRQAHDLVSLVPHLEGMNREGWDIYAGPNARKAENLSGDENVASFRVVFVDFDHLDADGASCTEIAMSTIADTNLPVPTMLIFSGHGCHGVWTLTESIDRDRWVNIQKRLIATLGTDPVIKNPERIMRLPGFQNVKAEPVDCFIVQADAGAVYAADEIEQALPELATVKEPRPAIPAQRANGSKEAKARAVLYAARWEGCSEGHRNSAAYRHACQLLRDFGLSSAHAWEILTDWNQSNTPQLSEEELRDAFTNAEKYGDGTVGSKLVEGRSAKRHAPAPRTAAGDDPASELESLIEAEIDGRYVNVVWPWPLLTDFGQCLTPGTRTMIVGTIGGSKSLALLQAVSLWVESGLKVAVLELERGRDFHLKRVLAQRTGIAELTKPKWVRENAEPVRALFNRHRPYLNSMGAAIHTAPRQFTTVQAGDWIEQRAAEGHRILAIDPVTALARGREPWHEDDAFMSRAEKAATAGGVSLVFITHAKKGAGNFPDLDSLAGSTAWARFADAILWLQSHDMKLSTVKVSCGTDEQKHDRTLHLLKTRSGEGTGLRLAYRFEVGRDRTRNEALTLRELGIIVKGKQ